MVDSLGQFEYEAVPGRFVLCVGETMAVLTPRIRGLVRDGDQYVVSVGGAESNVASYLAALGQPVWWVSRLGDDAFGHMVHAKLSRAGVRMEHVTIDDDAPTGAYVKELSETASTARYYRRGSAASRMGPSDVTPDLYDWARLVHSTGITAALSPSCEALMRDLVSRPRTSTVLSFDVNWRPALWGPEGPEALAELARAADIVFVGRDEAEAMWGRDEPASIAEFLREPPMLVVKDADCGATLVSRGASTSVPSLSVEVVEPVGAGDAFAAGFLHAVLTGEDERTCLRTGHAVAAAALTTTRDVGSVDSQQVATLVAMDDDEWGSTRVGAMTAQTAEGTTA